MTTDNFAEALRTPGVCAILTAAEYFSDGHGVPEADVLGIEGGAFRYRPGAAYRLARARGKRLDRVTYGICKRVEPGPVRSRLWSGTF